MFSRYPSWPRATVTAFFAHFWHFPPSSFEFFADPWRSTSVPGSFFQFSSSLVRFLVVFTMKKEVKEKSGDPGWVEFCQRMNINPNLVMLKVTLFVMYGGKNYDFFFRFWKFCHSSQRCVCLRANLLSGLVSFGLLTRQYSAAERSVQKKKIKFFFMLISIPFCNLSTYSTNFDVYLYVDSKCDCCQVLFITRGHIHQNRIDRYATLVYLRYKKKDEAWL